MSDIGYILSERGFVRLGAFEQFFATMLLDADDRFNSREAADMMAINRFPRSLPVARRYLSVLVKRGVLEEVRNPQDTREKAYSFTIGGRHFAIRLKQFTGGIKLKTWEMKI